MAASHSHSHSGDVPDVPVARGAVTVLLGFLLVCAAATAIAVVALWPDADKVEALKGDTQFAAPGVTFLDATVTEIQPSCPDPRSVRADCGQLVVELDEGPEKGTAATMPVPGFLAESGLAEGDTVLLQRVPPQEGHEAIYSFDGIVRLQPLWILGVVFVLVVAAVARLRGILALVSLGFGGAVLFMFMLPALLSGSSGLAVALAGASAIMFVVLYLAHGPSVRTSAALAGTLLGVGITAAVGELAVRGATLSGVADDSSAQLSAYATDLSFRGLLMCALVVAGLGILNDVTITQSSAVWELRAAGPGLSRSHLFTSGMRIGRDHIASTIYTIVFAYAGSALAVLLLLSLYDRPLLDLLSWEPIAEEIVRTLASGIGLVLAVPVTTAIAALTVGGPGRLTNEDEVGAYERRH
jgi:uncharacterized membrane protein